MDLPDFSPEHLHLLLQGVYRDFLYHNNVSHLYGGVLDEAVWQHCWRRLAAQLVRWYATPFGVSLWIYWLLNGMLFLMGFGNLRYPLSFSTSF